MTGRQAKSEYAQIAVPAVHKVRLAVKAGKLTKTDCADCGSSGPVQGHHHNGYDDEHALDVVWLCRSCHLSRHGRRLLPPWERGTRAYMLRTRGPHNYRVGEHARVYSDLTPPKRLLKHVEWIWALLVTVEERAAMVALVDHLKEGTP